MKKKLVFCEYAAVENWVLRRVADATRRRVRDDRRPKMEQTVAMLDHLWREGLGLACTVTAAASIVTTLYKGDLPLEGETRGFLIRKLLARDAAQFLREGFQLLAPNAAHFERAEELWFTWCQKGVKEAYAEFANYIDVALVLNPPDEITIPHVFVGHGHIPYVLGKTGAKQIIHYV